MIFREIPKTKRISHSWYKDIVLAAKKLKGKKAVFIPNEEVTSGYFSDAVRHAGRRLGVKVKLSHNKDGFYCWIEKMECR